MISRRTLLGALASAPLSACNTVTPGPTVTAESEPSWYAGFLTDAPHPVPLVDRRYISADEFGQLVPYQGSERPGTIVVNLDERFLYLVQGSDTAIRYGVGVGRRGFAWKGTAYVGRKAAWPDWGPTTTMVSLKPDLPRFQKGGPDNPLGARALYLYQNGRDILFRIHGTNEPWTIGQQVSSGCIRMLNEEVLDLYERVPVGTTVLVRRSAQRRA
jgi:lipoprotein-anchoring transpeptidase ErfK/SrfK